MRQMRMMMLALLATLLLAPQAAMVQGLEGAAPATKPYKIIGVVWRGETNVEKGFRDYLAQRGIPFEMTVRNLNLDIGNAPAIVDEIRREDPDLVYTWGTGTAANIYGRLDTETPDKFVGDRRGVFTLVAYPEHAKIVESFESPGRPVTGVAFLAPVESQLNAILAYRPFEKIAVIYDSTASNSRINVEQMREAVKSRGIEMIELPVPLGEDGKPQPGPLPDLVREAKSRGAQLLYMGPDSFLTRHGDLFTQAAIDEKLPTFASTEAPLRGSRAMFGLVADYYVVGKLTGLQAERILVDGLRPEDVPVAHLGRYKLWINMDVVHEVGLYPPVDMLSIADVKTGPAS